MKTKTEISVLLSAHNAEKTLRMAIRSTLKALPKTGELLLCLHKCSDNSQAISESFSDRRLKIFKLDEGSFSDALNFLISCASGELVARMDADDICLPWRFRLQSGFLKKHPELDAVFSTAVIFGEAIRPFFVFPQYTTQLHPPAFNFLLTQCNPAVHPTLLARKGLLERLKYQDVPGEDLDLWLRIANDGGKIARTRFPVLLYRSHHNQMSRNEVYLEGWKASEAIREMRLKLCEAPLNKSLAKSRLRFALRHPLITLEIIGLPTPQKIFRWLTR